MILNFFELKIISTFEILNNELVFYYTDINNIAFRKICAALEVLGFEKHQQPYSCTWTIMANVEQIIDNLLIVADTDFVNKKPCFSGTCDEVIDLMIEFSGIIGTEKILEPSAGEGNIIRRLKTHYPEIEIHYCEVNRNFPDIPEGISVGSDFFELHLSNRYDVILMNPPFDNANYEDHIAKATEHIKDSGVIVSVVPEIAFHRFMKKEIRKLADYYSASGYRVRTMTNNVNACSYPCNTRLIKIQKQKLRDG